MSNLKNQNIANKIRTKLLLLIAKESMIKIDENTNLSMLNSVPLNEINKQYQIKNFKITIDNKVINGGKNLCINYSSKVNSRPFINNLLNEQFEKYVKNNSKIDPIKLGIKRKISQYKLNIVFKKEKFRINSNKKKLIEIQKNYICFLRSMANLLKNYSLNKKDNPNFNRQKSVKIRESDVEYKLKNKLNKNRFHTNKELSQNKNLNVLVKNKNTKKKKITNKLNINTDIDEITNENKQQKVKSVKYLYSVQNYKSLFDQTFEEESMN